MFLLVGGDSEIGAATHRLLQARGQSAAATTRRPEQIAPDRPFLDLTAAIDHWTAPLATRAACIFAAIARLASCHDDPVGSARVNVTQTLALIERLVAHGIHVLFLSTNQVFDGTMPNMPADAPHSPVSEYGRQKAQVETALRRHIDRGAPVAILRLAKVVSPQMPLISGWITALSSGLPIHAFEDMRMAPTPIELVSGAIGELLQDRAAGIFQLTGPRDVTYAEVGYFLAERLNANPSQVTVASARSSMPEGSTPWHTTLESQRLRDRYGFLAPDAWEVVDRMLSASRQTPDPVADDTFGVIAARH